MDSEELWRAALHDLNNLLAGIQGVIDLSDPALPLDARNRMRLECTLEDGKTLIAMARALALGRHPDPGLSPWSEWKAGLSQRLESLAALYRCPMDLLAADGMEDAPWPTPQFQDWAAAFTRQILPWAAPGPLHIEASLDPDAWLLTWLCDAPMPSALRPEPPPDAPRNLPSLWLRAASERLGITLQETPRGLVARMARTPVA